MNITTVNKDQIKKAAKDFSGWSGCAKIMIDLADGEVWTDVFESSESWANYHADTIICIIGKGDLHGRNDKISAERLEKYCNKLIELYKNVAEEKWDMGKLELAWSDIWHTV